MRAYFLQKQLHYPSIIGRIFKGRHATRAGLMEPVLSAIVPSGHRVHDRLEFAFGNLLAAVSNPFTLVIGDKYTLVLGLRPGHFWHRNHPVTELHYSGEKEHDGDSLNNKS